MAGRTAFPDGHFYSPVVDVDEIAADAGRIWPAGLPDVPGVDLAPGNQRRFVVGPLTRFIPEFDYPEHPARAPGADESVDDDRFYVRNSQFSWLDARSLFAMLRERRPKRLVEIGSGYSSLLAADVNVRFLGGSMRMTCVEPYPRPFLQRGVAGIDDVLVARAQDVDPAFFAGLRAGDVLFIDSSHVAKTGSDVVHLYLQVLPALASGVIVHVHDIFLPFDYPRDWVDAGRNWNEQYLLQALLVGGATFEVLFSCAYAAAAFPVEVGAALGRPAYGGGSFWMRRR